MIPQLDKRSMDMDEYHHHHGNKPMTRAQQMRKIKKPILEKKRRDRINRSLDDLKDLMMKVYNKDVSDHKLEKADILELTVQYLQVVNSGGGGVGGVGDAVSQYRSGYEQCLAEVSRYLQLTAAPTPAAHGLHQRLHQHCVDKLHTSAAAATVTSPATPPELMAPMSPPVSAASLGAAGLGQPVFPTAAAALMHHHEALLAMAAAAGTGAAATASSASSEPLHLTTAPGPCGGGASCQSPASSDLSSCSSASSEPMWRPW